MIVFPNCKINIGLNIVGKRADGYHDLESVFYPVLLKDIIEIVPSQSFRFIKSGIPVSGNDSDNTCVKAYHLLKRSFPDLSPITIYLHKNIPSGSGLGGGSADGAFMLKLLNEKFELNLSTKQLIDLALEVGSDCPFFIVNRSCFVTGRGEFVEDFPLDLSEYYFVLIHPGIHISTSQAFANIKPSKPQRSIREILKDPVEKWKDQLVNDFEKNIIREYRPLHNIRERLYDSGAIYAAMSGSGSSFYGIFKKNTSPTFSFDKNFRVDIIK